MPLTRHFLGWDGPCLPRASEWLRDRYRVGSNLDLSGITVVTQGRRASRRLREILAEASSGGMYCPPDMASVGEIPSRVVASERLPAPRLLSHLLRFQALRHAEPGVVRRAFPVPPETDDVRGWLSLVGEMERLHRTLAGEGLRFAAVAERCARENAKFPDIDRWGALAELHELYLRELDRTGFADEMELRILSAEGKFPLVTNGPLVLVAVSDMPRTTQKIVNRAAESREIHLLIHAPEDEAHRFDNTGCFEPASWVAVTPPLSRAEILVVDQPCDQAHTTLSSLRGEIRPDDITIGIGDESMGRMIARRFAAEGVPCRLASGRAVETTGPGLFLDAYLRFIRTRKPTELAVLVRHPQVEIWLQEQLSKETGGFSFAKAFDEYFSRTFRFSDFSGSLDERGVAARIGAAHRAAASLVPSDADVSKPPGEWADFLAGLFRSIYGNLRLNRYRDSDRATLESLEAISGILASLSRIPVADSSEDCFRVTLIETIEIVRNQLRAASIPAEGGPPAVEVVGWLELQMDDAPRLIVMGFNEGNIPGSVKGDGFLPDALRAALGIPDRAHRFARDIMTLTTILHSRDSVTLVAGRHNSSGDPLSPSRLLLLGSDDNLRQQLARFYRLEEFSGSIQSRTPPLFRPSAENRLLIPAPEKIPAITRMRATAFKSYIECPYRFYLRQILRIERQDDTARELDGRTFGTLIHQVLKDFAESAVADSDDEDRIAEFLSEALDRVAAGRFGSLSTLIGINIELARQRLLVFAEWQALQRKSGWRIIRSELAAVAPVDVDGAPFTITGTIDRIDRHDGDGKIRILDYKTSETADSPEKTHRKKGDWIDLQLPLYRMLARSEGIHEEPALGIVKLARTRGEFKEHIAGWTEEDLVGADEKAREIIRNVRAGRFWPPGPAPSGYLFEDEFVSICMDRYIDRDRVIELSGRLASDECL